MNCFIMIVVFVFFFVVMLVSVFVWECNGFMIGVYGCMVMSYVIGGCVNGICLR